MELKKVDEVCEALPVRFLDHIQDFGALLRVEKKTGRISHASENTEEVFGMPCHKILGQTVFALKEHPRIKPVIKYVEEGVPKKTFPWEPVFQNAEEEILIHEEEKHLLFEWVFFESQDQNKVIDRFNSITQLFYSVHMFDSLHKNLQHCCEQIASALEFDKALVYHFLEDGHGEVVAEAKNNEMDTYWGLHFPASDVPSQVRETFIVNPLRVILNTGKSQVAIKSIESNASIDLTNCLSKGISPVHLQYTKNMGLATSLSYAIIVRNKLWGLVCFHHRSPKEVSYQNRLLLSLFGKILETAVEFENNRVDLEFQKKRKDILLRFFDTLMNSDKNFISILLDFKNELLDLLNVKGFCLYFDGVCNAAGEAPPYEEMKKLVDWTKGQIKERGCFVTDCLHEHYPDAKKIKDTAAGIAAFSIGTDSKDMVVWFRPEQKRSVKWGGNPNEKIIHGEGADLQPRRSFAAWESFIELKSYPWQPKELEAAIEIRDSINRSILKLLYFKKKLNETEVLQLTLAADGVNEGIFILSSDCKVVWCNEWFNQFIGLQKAAVGQDFFMLLQSVGGDSVVLDKNPISVGKEWKQEVSFVKEQSAMVRFIRFRINSYTVNLAGDQRFIGIASDVTELKQATDELLRLNKQKDQFISMAAHDLRNPLTLILAATSILKDTKRSEEEVKLTLESMLRQGQSMLQLLNELLNIAVIESGKFLINKAKVDLKKFFNDLILVNKILAEKKGITLLAEIDLSLSFAYLDQNKIKQVIDNLLSNAIKYSSSGTTITLRAHATEKMLRVEVEDQGPGIPTDQQKLVFQQFAKLSPRPTGGETSSGLGLAICKQIVLALGGEIGFTSEPNKGSKFFFSVPISAAGLQLQLVELRKILILFDDPGLLCQAKAVLSNLPNLEIQTASSQDDLVKIAASFVPDMILFEGLSVKRESLSIIKELHRLPSFSKIPIVLFSDTEDQQEIDSLFKTGSIEVVAKPISPKELSHHILRIWSAWQQKKEKD